jgi:hypothetical protein
MAALGAGFIKSLSRPLAAGIGAAAGDGALEDEATPDHALRGPPHPRRSSPTRNGRLLLGPGEKNLAVGVEIP